MNISVKDQVQRSNINLLLFNSIGLGVIILYLINPSLLGHLGNSKLILVLLIPAFLLTLWNIQNSIRRFINPTLHPIFHSLSKYGNPLKIADTIDNELKNIPIISKNILSQNWLIVRRFFTTDFIFFNEIIWVYKRTTNHSINYIPNGSSFDVIVNMRFGKQYTINSDEFGVSKIIEHITQRVPWIIVGYSEDINKLYRKSREELIRYVNKRHELTLLKLHKDSE